MSGSSEAADEPIDGRDVPPPGVVEILDQLAALAGTAPRVPWSSRAVVDADELAALVDELRSRLPRDLDEARAIVADRVAILGEAEITARELLAEAEAEADRLVRQHNVSHAAEDYATRLLADAEDRATHQLEAARQAAADLLADATAAADRQRAAADDYALDVLRRLETQLTNFQVSVRKGIDSLETG